MLNTLEQSVRSIGYVRSPNRNEIWYPSFGGAKRPSYPYEISVRETIRLTNATTGKDVLEFKDAAELKAWVDINGVVVEPGANVWD